jgi:hypothetical protein
VRAALSIQSGHESSSREGLRRTIDTLRWRVESTEEELIAILSERASTLSIIEQKEAELAALPSSGDEEL